MELHQGEMRQVQEAGKTLVALSVKHSSIDGQTPTAPVTPARRFGRPADSYVPSRERTLVR